MNNTAPDIRAERSDIQAIVLSGLSSLTHSRSASC